MTDERRDAERAPTFHTVELITVDPSGQGVSFPIILRDAGEFGLGGVYVGQGPFAPEGDAILQEADGAERRVRIVWTRKVADYVHMVGLADAAD